MRLVPRFVAVLALALLAGIPTHVHAANSGAAVAIYNSGLRVPVHVATQPDSGALILFLDTRSGSAQLFVQRVDRNGRPLLGADGDLLLTLPPNEYLDYTSIVSDGAGGCVFAWAENRGASGKDIIVQRVLPNGSVGYGPGGLVVCNANRDQTAPRVVPGPAGHYYVVWLDDRAAAGDLRDIFAQKMTSPGAPQWAVNGLAVNAAGLRPYHFYGILGLTADLQDGFVVGWSADGTGSGTRVQRVNSAGSLLWTANGVYFINSSASVYNLTPDGTGGVWGTTTTWDGTYLRAFAHRMQSTGVPAFPVAGIQFHSPAYQGSIQTTLVRNGSGGMFLIGMATYSSTSNVFPLFRQEISPAGALLRGPDGDSFGSASQTPVVIDAGPAILIAQLEQAGTGRTKLRLQRYAFDGTPFYVGAGVLLGRDEPSFPALSMTASMTPDGLIAAAWADRRYATPTNDFNYQVFGQTFDSQGSPLWIDSELPDIQTVRDAAADQGGYVRVTWNASIADHPAAAVATEYRVWRALPASEVVSLEDAQPLGGGVYLDEGRTLLQYESLFWELAGEQGASTLPSYAMTVPTMLDSVAGNPADQSFMVEAVDDSNHHWFSAVLIGHSVDNLPPGAVQGASLLYSGGTSSLYWGGVSDADLARYEVFRGFTPGFVPSDANRIGTTTTTTFSDPHGLPAYYRIAARDVHGNLGPSSLAQGTVGVEDGAPVTWELRSNWDRRRTSLDLTLDVPHADQGRIELFDVTGRRLWGSEYRSEAARSFRFQVDGAAALKSGLVFVRASSASGRQLVSRTVLVR